MAATLIALGLLMCAYGGLIFASIPESDTATGTLVVFGLVFALPGLAAAGDGAWRLRRDFRAAGPRSDEGSDAQRSHPPG